MEHHKEKEDQKPLTVLIGFVHQDRKVTKWQILVPKKNKPTLRPHKFVFAYQD